jgi:hypothetical protein
LSVVVVYKHANLTVGESMHEINGSLAPVIDST